MTVLITRPHLDGQGRVASRGVEGSPRATLGTDGGDEDAEYSGGGRGQPTPVHVAPTVPRRSRAL